MSRAFRKLEQPETTFEYDQRTVMNCFPSALYTVDAYNILYLNLHYEVIIE